ncbi:hypothetical protein [Limnobacter parvus]|uniref:Leucine-rich repeat domain-containing protein n=1 Tax=Limnobacter parvus TaxID=2939690 RepID=A0ABT1XFS9_9BURK|nr:hypothetical protein [Limnobacter parvus]MCR2746137.1 hypothetical protein [Limnobacter parvus]
MRKRPSGTTFANGLSQLKQLEYLDFGFGYLPNNLQAAQVVFNALGSYAQLKTLTLDCLYQLQSAEVIEAFCGVLSKHRQLQHLSLSNSKLDDVIENPITAKAFYQCLGELKQLETLHLDHNRLGYLPDVKYHKPFFDCLSQLPKLHSLSIAENGLSENADQLLSTNSFCYAVDSLTNLTNLFIHDYYHCEGDASYGLYVAHSSSRLRSNLRAHNNVYEHHKLLVENQPWAEQTERILLEKSKSVTDAMSAFQMLAFAHDRGELSWPQVQVCLEGVCLSVLNNLVQVDVALGGSLDGYGPPSYQVRDEDGGYSDGPIDTVNLERRSEAVRKQELARLLSLVHYGENIGALTRTAALNIKLHIQGKQSSRQAFPAQRAFQENQQPLLDGLHSVRDALGLNTNHAAQFHTQYSDYFHQLASTQQQPLEKQNQLVRAHKYARKNLDAEVQGLQSEQARIGNGLYQTGLKILSTQRIKAIGGGLPQGIVYLPWVGGEMVQASQAIAKAVGVAKLNGFAAGVESLKNSLATMGSDSVFQKPPHELRNFSLGENLQAQGIQLPEDAIAIQLADINLGELADSIQTSSNATVGPPVQTAASRTSAFSGRLRRLGNWMR